MERPVGCRVGKSHAWPRKYIDAHVFGTPRPARVKSALWWRPQESRRLPEPEMSFYFMGLFFHETKTAIKEKNLL